MKKVWKQIGVGFLSISLLFMGNGDVHANDEQSGQVESSEELQDWKLQLFSEKYKASTLAALSVAFHVVENEAARLALLHNMEKAQKQWEDKMASLDLSTLPEKKAEVARSAMTSAKGKNKSNVAASVNAGNSKKAEMRSKQKEKKGKAHADKDKKWSKNLKEQRKAEEKAKKERLKEEKEKNKELKKQRKKEEHERNKRNKERKKDSSD